MKILTTLLLCALTTAAFAQVLNDNFDRYQSANELSMRYRLDQMVRLDTNFRQSAPQSLRLNGTTEFVIQTPLRNAGRLEVSLFSEGVGTWSLTAFAAKGFNADPTRPDDWTQLDALRTVRTDRDAFTTNTLKINRTENTLLRLRFELRGEANGSYLYVDDLLVKEITSEARAAIVAEQERKRIQQERQAALEQFAVNQNYSNARELVSGYEVAYAERIRSLARLYRNTEVIELISGTAASLGEFNQLSNPLEYEKYDALKAQLFPQLEPIDKLYYMDEVEGKIRNFFDRIRNPLNLVVGIGDMFTGGGISKVINNFKALVTKAYGPERLAAFQKKPDRALVNQQQQKGIKLYKEAQQFFSEIEAQNERALKLNRDILGIYAAGGELNRQILSVATEYFKLAQIPLDEDGLVELGKNQNYARYDADIRAAFQLLLGDETNLNTRQLTFRLRELDVYFQKIDELIRDYQRLANEMSSFYSDFNKSLDPECPYTDVTEADRAEWRTRVLQLRGTLDDLEQRFNRAYLDVEFR